MPPVRTTKRSTSPVEVSSSLLYSTSVTPEPYYQQSPTTSTEIGQPQKKKRSHGKARPPGHISRPPNAFIIFRTEYIKSLATQNSTPEVSKNVGECWRNMTAAEKAPWKKKAEEAKIQHQIDHPNYKYKPVHPRDEHGNCIRKPRKPNRPRVPKYFQGGELVEDLATSFQWMEEKQGAQWLSNAAASGSSSTPVSPPPPSPSPPPFFPQLYQQRRSSSVPLPGPDNSFFFGMAPMGTSYWTPADAQTNFISRRLSKRPSTSMDFIPTGQHPETQGAHHESYLSVDDSSQWKAGHRRSISAPGFGDMTMAQTAYAQTYNITQEANSLTPINPVFDTVFDRFSWGNASNPGSAAPATSQFLFPDYNTFVSRPQDYLSVNVNIPSMTNSPTSNMSSAAPSSAPMSPAPVRLQHPAPIASFDIVAFQNQLRDFTYNAVTQQNETSQPFPDDQGNHLENNVLGLTSSNTDGLYQGKDGGDASYYGHNGSSANDPNAAGTPVAGLRPLHGEQFQPSQQRPTEITPPCPLDFNELIVESY